MYNIFCTICVIASFVLTFYSIDMWKKAEKELENLKSFKGGFIHKNIDDMKFTCDEETDHLIKYELKREVKK